MPSPLRVTHSRERDGSLSVTVNSSAVLKVRRAIVRSGCHPVGIVKAVPIAGGTRVRLLIASRRELIPRVTEAIARAIEAWPETSLPD
jgi:hypothetical protein